MFEVRSRSRGFRYMRHHLTEGLHDATRKSRYARARARAIHSDIIMPIVLRDGLNFPWT